MPVVVRHGRPRLAGSVNGPPTPGCHSEGGLHSDFADMLTGRAEEALAGARVRTMQPLARRGVTHGC